MMGMEQGMKRYGLRRGEKEESCEFKSVVWELKKRNGELDFKKMFDRGGEMMSRMNEVG